MTEEAEPVTAAAALAAADAATRMGVRRHPVVLAAILSDFAVRAIEIAAAINRGRGGGLDRPLIRTLARDLSRDLDRALEYARLHQHHLELTVTGRGVLLLTLDHAPERYLSPNLVRYVRTALHLARGLGVAIDARLGRHLDLSLSVSRDHDLDLACDLAAGLDSAIGRALASAVTIDPSRRTFDLALERARALDRVCAHGVAGRLGIPPAEGLAGAILDGAMDDFTSADLTYASLARCDLTGMRWSRSGTTWPPGASVKALVARSRETEPGSGILVVSRPVMIWPPLRLA